MAMPTSSATSTFTLPSVQCNTSGVFQPTESSLGLGKSQINVLYLKNLQS